MTGTRHKEGLTPALKECSVRSFGQLRDAYTCFLMMWPLNASSVLFFAPYHVITLLLQERRL